MACSDDKMRQLMVDLLPKEMSAETRRLVRVHIDACPDCAMALKDVSWLRQGIRAFAAAEQENHPLPNSLVSLVHSPDEMESELYDDIELHLLMCPSCEEEVSILRMARDGIDENDSVSPQLGRIIPLAQMKRSNGESLHVLAADSPDDTPMCVSCLATLYSDDPEIVVQLMRDPERGDYLHAISDDPGLVAGVMIQLPDLDLEFVTDDSGHAFGIALPPEALTMHSWQVKLPDAVFDLKPLAYDPEHPEYSKEAVLETDKGDRVRIVFEGIAQGKQIELQILELDGRTDFDDCTMHISQAENATVLRASRDADVRFDIANPKQPIKIRIFQ